MSQQPLNPIKDCTSRRQGELGSSEDKALGKPSTRREEINQLKKALKDLVVFTNPPQRENPVSPTSIPLHWCHDA